MEALGWIRGSFGLGADTSVGSAVLHNGQRPSGPLVGIDWGWGSLEQGIVGADLQMLPHSGFLHLQTSRP